MPSGTDNTASEAGFNKLFSAAWPLQLFLEVVAAHAQRAPAAHACARASERVGVRPSNQLHRLADSKLYPLLQATHSHVGGSHYSFSLPSGTNNSATEAGINKLFSTSWPLQLFLQLVATWANVLLQPTHVPRRLNDWRLHRFRNHSADRARFSFRWKETHFVPRQCTLAARTPGCRSKDPNNVRIRPVRRNPALKGGFGRLLSWLSSFRGCLETLKRGFAGLFDVRVVWVQARSNATGLNA